MKEEFDIVIPKTWLQLLLRPRYIALAHIMKLGQLKDYLIPVFTKSYLIIISLENEKCSVWTE